MPRIRTLKPEHRQHRKVGKLSDRTYRLWVGMLCEADDDGRLICDAEHLRVTVFGYHPRVSSQAVEGAVQELSGAGLIRTYTVEGVRYADFPSWEDHQVINKRRKSQLPDYPGKNAPTGTLPELDGSIPVGSERIGRDQGSEGIGGERTTSVGPGLPTSAPLASNGFKIPESVAAALKRAPRLGADPKLNRPGWWQAEVRANPGVDYAAEVLKAEAWMSANPQRAARRDLSRFLHTWLSRADREEG